ncbi:superinfection immunity protein [Helicobacter canis]|uniref:Superinfection immunity protein n=2 Tax=Helicobacter canis TaxID=29419 RepID=V8CLD7_9HELI|nr:superinfection immunity protein [Helicobacter canis]ETD27840.1 hypothetical protein HMPREF2087_00763 [Helicobacter canis NCTC 12740]KAA8710105.1 superinfection immunity protein [Helicobacter canis]
MFEKERLIIIDGVEILTRSVDYWSLGTFVLIIIASIFIYFLPSLIAMFSHHRDRFLILIINVFFGWSVLGWFIALIWSFIRR